MSRTYQHIIDTKAIKLTLNSIPDYCVVRDLNERDYGIDLMVEIFSKDGVDEHGYDKYEASGNILYLQIKGTNNELKINQDNTISFSLEKKALQYVEKFTTPFILVRVCTLSEKQEVYFLWLQRYIIDVLEVEHPNWRNKSQDAFTVRVPIKNKLPENFEKIKHIASRLKYIEEYLEFHERFSNIILYIPYIIGEAFDDYNFILTHLNRINNLKTLLSKNDCCINHVVINEFITYIKSIANGDLRPINEEDFPHISNLRLLHTSGSGIMFVENFIAEFDGDTVY